MRKQLKQLFVFGIFASGIAATGCTGDGYDRVADNCWPDRYSNESRRLQHELFIPQVQNGHVLDQTLWNTHFERGTGKLNAAGMDKLDQLSRRRPQPDTTIYLQTARDIAYDAEKPGAYGEMRVKLDNERIEAVKSYLSATTTGRPTQFQVIPHDPAVPGIDGAEPRVVIPSPAVRAGVGANAQGGGAVPGAGAGVGVTPGAGSAPAGNQMPAAGNP